MEHHIVDEVEDVVAYDQIRFVSHRAQENYYRELVSKKLFLERGIALEKVAELLPNFYHRLETFGWMCFAPEQCKANEQWVRD